ncbi:cdkn1a interacting zinc finger protein 1b isoform X2 [Esox lucius]|uniref:cdkn1a interacting zinc finger protein 1b isoform X2 n=1 Tax=Esox lucius TaxID=8010 RepID=UPI001476CC35|nr:cdkn1a interacting zinc finger protein 1b isoform X2 [Esox lucius]
MFEHQQMQHQIQHNQRLWQQLKTTQRLPSQLPRQHQKNRPRFPPSPSMVNLCPVPQAALGAPNPMLQGAVLIQQRMQANVQDLAMGSGLPFSLLAKGAQHSLLGPAPVPRLGFSSSRPYRSHNHFRNKDILGTKRDYEQIGKANGQLGTSKTDCPVGRTTNTEMGKTESDRLSFAQPQEKPELKKLKANGVIHRSEDDHVNVPFGHVAVRTSNDKRPMDVLKPTVVAALVYGGECPAVHGLEECGDESRASDVLGVRTSLKVTIQHSSQSRAFSTGIEEPGAAMGPSCGSGGQAQDNDPGHKSAADSHYCYICSTPCHNQQNFQSHMNGAEHQRRMLEIQHVSNTCLVNLLPWVADSQHDLRTGWDDKTGGVQRWCAICQTHFSGDLIEHRRTQEHKLSKQSSRPFCTVCKRHFRTPRKFVEHMKSREHKLQVELREEGEPDVLEELITVDAVGCFEGEDDFEEETHEDDDSKERQPGERHVAQENIEEHEEYDSETQYGPSFVVPVAGYLCRLCHKFFHFESTARHLHCKSLMHFQNLQKYKVLSRKCSVTEDTGKTCSRMSGDPLPLRYSRDDMEDIRKGCTNKSIMAGDSIHACCTPATKQISPIVSALENAEQGNITATQQVSEQLDADDHRPTCHANQPHLDLNSVCDNLKEYPCLGCQNPQLRVWEGEKASGAGCSLHLPLVYQNTDGSVSRTTNETMPERLLERERQQQESYMLLTPHVPTLDKNRQPVYGEEPVESTGIGPAKGCKRNSTRTSHPKTGDKGCVQQ